MEEKNTTKEINLLQLLNVLFAWLSNVTKKFFNFLGLLLQLMVKHWMLVLIVYAVVISAGLFLSRTSAAKYKAGAVMLLYGSDLSTAKEVCRQIQNSISTNQTYSLSHKLGIPDSVAQNIIGIENFNIIDYLKNKTPDAIDFKRTHSLTDTLNLVMTDRMYLQVITKNISQLPVVQDALLKYFNDNQMMQQNFLSEKLNLEDRVASCDKELNRLDSLAKVTYFKDANKNVSFENNRLVVGEQRKQLFYDDVLRLQDVKFNTKKLLVEFKQPAVFPSGLVLTPTPINNRTVYGLYSIIIATLIALVLVCIIENFKKISKYLTRKN